jgi:capsular polysaccharide transport system permease protein
MSDKPTIEQSANAERIRKWRERQAKAPTPPVSRAKTTPPGSRRTAEPDIPEPPRVTPPPRRVAQPEAAETVAAATVPTRRAEELAAADALRSELTESQIPSPTEIAAEVAATEQKRWWAKLNLRRNIRQFIGIPMLIILLYGLIVAPNGQAVDSSFVIIRPGETADASQVAGLIGTGGGEGLADAYRIREYLKSREAMLAMEKQHGFLSHFRQGTRDPFSRPIDLPAIGLNNYDFYQRRINIGIDTREGIVRLKVEALTPEDSQRFANGLLALARERTKAISDILNSDQITSLKEDVRRAEEDMRSASDQLASAQRRQRELDPQVAATTTYQLIGNLEATLVGRQAQRDSILANGMSESPLLARIDAEIVSIRKQIDKLRARLASSGGNGSLVDVVTDLGPANTRLRLSQLGLEASLRTLEQANLNTIDQRRYLVVISNPVLPYQTWQRRLIELLGLTLILAVIAWGATNIWRSSNYLAATQ